MTAVALSDILGFGLDFGRCRRGLEGHGFGTGLGVVALLTSLIVLALSGGPVTVKETGGPPFSAKRQFLCHRLNETDNYRLCGRMSQFAPSN